MENTQPLALDWAHAPGVFMHNGELTGMTTRLREEFGHDPRQGTADSEGAALILARDLKAACDIDSAWPVFTAWAQQMRYMGIGNFVVALGRDIFVHVHRRTQLGEDIADDPGLFLAREPGRLRLSSEPFSDTDEPLSRGRLLWLRDGEILESDTTST